MWDFFICSPHWHIFNVSNEFRCMTIIHLFRSWIFTKAYTDTYAVYIHKPKVDRNFWLKYNRLLLWFWNINNNQLVCMQFENTKFSLLIKVLVYNPILIQACVLFVKCCTPWEIFIWFQFANFKMYGETWNASLYHFFKKKTLNLLCCK